MEFNKHHNLVGSHAILSASNYHWVNYDDEKLRNTYESNLAKERGTQLHALAEQLIRMKIRLPRNGTTLSRHVNDAIGFRMEPEVVLFYSPNVFGTSDAISFDEHKGLLRISDLKTGVHPAKFTQLHIYGALFCLEYGIDPNDIQTEFRIYQNDDVMLDDSDEREVLKHLADKIVHFDEIIRELNAENQGWRS